MAMKAASEKARTQEPRQSLGRVAQSVNLALFLAGLAVIVVTVNYFGREDRFRAQIDATKTRAYSLSGQSRNLLASLQGDWKIALVMSERRTDRAMRRQIDEVLKRYTDASPHISVMRIDPDNPQTLADYDAMISDLRGVYRDQIAAYDKALDQGMATLKDLEIFAQQQSTALEQVVSLLAANNPDRAGLQQRSNAISLLADQGSPVSAAVGGARKISEARPLPDYEAARSALAYSLSEAAAQLDEVANFYSRMVSRSGGDQAARQLASVAAPEYQRMSRRLAEVADQLKRLPPMELSSIGAQLQQGEAAVIISPQRAAVIPSAQLFPKSNVEKNIDTGAVTYDQRFRGEQLISATIRSLTVAHMPLVVFVHADETSLLQPREHQADVVGAALVLQTSRFELAEWRVTQQPERPVPERNQPAVWIILPPAQRLGIQPGKPEQMLIAAATKLIDDGEPVLLSVFPSIVSRYGQADPWATLAAPFGLAADTSRVIYEQVRAGDQMQDRLAQLVNDYPDSHLISRAIAGQDAKFTMPVLIHRLDAAPANTQQTPIALIEASPDRWLEPQWSADPSHQLELRADAILREAAPIVVAAQRPSPVGKQEQRMMFVGSGSWLLSFDADLVVPIGGSRNALVYPGNYELMLASVSWLAGMDDLIAASPMSQEVSRLRDISPEARARWFWIIVAGLPLACIGAGAAIWFMRRA